MRAPALGRWTDIGEALSSWGFGGISVRTCDLLCYFCFSRAWSISTCSVRMCIILLPSLIWLLVCHGLLAHPLDRGTSSEVRVTRSQKLVEKSWHSMWHNIRDEELLEPLLVA
jgi:hypothetical protein